MYRYDYRLPIFIQYTTEAILKAVEIIISLKNKCTNFTTLSNSLSTLKS